MPPAAATLTTISRWADLPPDLLGDISGRLRDAADFTRLHAVCTPWRDALLSLRTPHPPFPPWLFTSSKGHILHSTVDLRRIDSSEISSMSSYRRSLEDVILVEPADGASFSGESGRNWVASEDGRAAYLFADRGLLNIHTGAVTPLPKFQELHDPKQKKLPMENLRGIVYGDGTVFLYNIAYKFGRHDFTVAILRPNHASWTFLNTTLASRRSGQPAGAAYHNGKVLVFVGVRHWRVLTLDGSGPNGHGMIEYLWNTNHKYLRDYSYVMESQGELLWVSVLVNRGGSTNDDPARALSLTVHALEEEGGGGGGNMRWVARDGRTLVDRILFLGAPASIVADAAQLSADGGCAYFVFRRGVFRYSFVDGEAKLVKQLRPVSGTDKACVWLQPQLPIAPIDEIRKRIDGPKKKKQRTSPIIRLLPGLESPTSLADTFHYIASSTVKPST